MHLINEVRDEINKYINSIDIINDTDFLKIKNSPSLLFSYMKEYNMSIVNNIERNFVVSCIMPYKSLYLHISAVHSDPQIAIAKCYLGILYYTRKGYNK